MPIARLWTNLVHDYYVFDGTYKGAIHTYLSCEIGRDLIAGTTALPKRHYAEEILRTYVRWILFPLLPQVSPPGQRLSKDTPQDRSFHLRYQRIVAMGTSTVDDPVSCK